MHKELDDSSAMEIGAVRISMPSGSSSSPRETREHGIDLGVCVAFRHSDRRARALEKGWDDERKRGAAT
jgi:hypothetical protein